MNNTQTPQYSPEQKRLGLRKVGEMKKPCLHPEHHRPMDMVLEDGIYEYECPGCGETRRFTVSSPICKFEELK